MKYMHVNKFICCEINKGSISGQANRQVSTREATDLPPPAPTPDSTDLNGQTTADVK